MTDPKPTSMTRAELAQFEILLAELKAAYLYRNWESIEGAITWLTRAVRIAKEYPSYVTQTLEILPLKTDTNASTTPDDRKTES